MSALERWGYCRIGAFAKEFQFSSLSHHCICFVLIQVFSSIVNLYLKPKMQYIIPLCDLDFIYKDIIFKMGEVLIITLYWVGKRKKNQTSKPDLTFYLLRIIHFYTLLLRGLNKCSFKSQTTSEAV